MGLSKLKWVQGIAPLSLLILSVFFALPVVLPGFLSWLNGLAAIPVLVVLYTQKSGEGSLSLRLSLLLVGLAALIMRRLDLYLMTLTMIPLGITLYAGIRRKESAAASGAKGVLVLALCWLLFWAGYGFMTHTNPYSELLKALDLDFQQMSVLYKTQYPDLSPETLSSIQTLSNGLREMVPRLLPGILATMVLLTVWVNMVIGSRFIAYADVPPWGTYKTWKLPDILVWLPIAALVGVIVGSGTVRDWALCLLMVSVLLYFFQGLAVLLAVLDRWNVPVLLRILLYCILVIQSYSLILITLLGISDVWFNVRQNRMSDTKDGLA